MSKSKIKYQTEKLLRSKALAGYQKDFARVILLGLYLELLGHGLGMYLTLLEIPWSFPKSLYCYTLDICNS